MNILHGKFIYKNGKISPIDSTRFNLFKNTLQEDQLLDVLFEVTSDTGTLSQLAKLHVCIRQLAIESGTTFEDMKFEIKRNSGLCVKKEYNGEKYWICKSFADCSKEELMLSMQTVIEVGDFIGVNLR